MKRFVFFNIFLLMSLWLGLMSTQVFAQEPWELYIDQEDGTCVIYTHSRRTKGFDNYNGYSFLYVVKKSEDEFSIGVSFPYHLDSKKEVSLETDEEHYLLNVALPDYAWTFSSLQDITLINTMLRADKFIKVRSYSINNTATVDYFSLIGFKDALRRLNSCHSKRLAKQR